MANRPIPAAETKRRLKALRWAEGNITRAAGRLGFSYATTAAWVQRCPEAREVVDNSKVGVTSRLAPVEARAASADKREDRKADLKAIQSAHQQAAALQAKLDVALALQASKHGRFEIPTYKPTGSQAIPVLVLSDLHMEETVRPEQVPGANNEYNLEIGVQRLRKVFQHGQYMVDTLRHMAKVDTLCLALLGDMISGHIHEDLVESNELSPTKATLHVMEHLNAGIEYLLKHGDYKKIIIPCCHGNHGRTGEKMRVQTSADSSYEWMAYQIMRTQWKNEKRLEWHITDGYHQYLNLFDTTVRFHHGDAIQYGGGVGGITIPVRKALANWNTVQRADLDVFGHFHQMSDGGDFISNGSLIGYNAYALKIKARFERPRQAFFLVDHKRGKTLSAEVFVE
jgi:hypothetical protein